MEKRGDLTENSRSDFDPRQKVKYADTESRFVAGEGDKHNLKNAVRVFTAHDDKPLAAMFKRDREYQERTKNVNVGTY